MVSKSTESRPTETYSRGNRGYFADFRPGTYYHQQYLAKNPRGYCPDHSCGVSFKSAELRVGEKA